VSDFWRAQSETVPAKAAAGLAATRCAARVGRTGTGPSLIP